MLSIMVVSHGISSYVKQCYRFLLETIPQEYEILLFVPRKDKQIISWANSTGISCFTGENLNLGAAYALLASQASGETLLFIHDDVVLLPGTIQAMIAALQDGEIAAVGPYTNRCQFQAQLAQSPDYKDFQGMQAMLDKVRQEKKAQEVLFLESFCMMIKKEAYHLVGGFAEYYASVGGEDIDLSFRLREKGYKLQLIPVYVHHERGTLASQHGAAARPALQVQVAEQLERNWGLHTGMPEELWQKPLLSFDWQRGGKPLIKASIRSCRLSAPLVSIMIPTYNRPLLFEKTLKSALSQTYPQVEIIICDNSTNEGTKNLMQNYIADERVRYIWNPEAKSKEENFMPFEQLARGEYLQWCMDDDILLPDKIKKMLGVFAAHPEVTLVTSRRGIIDATDKLYGKAAGPDVAGEYGIFDGGEIAKVMLITTANIVGEPSAVLFRRRDLQDHYWRADCRGYRVISDIAMWLQLLEKGDFAIFSEPLSYYRRHADQEGQQSDVVLLARREFVRLAEEYYARRVFLTTQEDFQQSLERNIIVANKTFCDVENELSNDKKAEFLTWLGDIEKRAGL